MMSWSVLPAVAALAASDGPAPIRRALQGGFGPPVAGEKLENYARVVEGTCESNHFEVVTTKEQCSKAALAFQYKITWGPNGGCKRTISAHATRIAQRFRSCPHHLPSNILNNAAADHDVVDGCSMRGSDSAFLNEVKTCEKGISTPDWVPGANGHATCACTEWQPCLCVRPFLESHWGGAVMAVLGAVALLYVRACNNSPAACFGLAPTLNAVSFHRSAAGSYSAGFRMASPAAASHYPAVSLAWC